MRNESAARQEVREWLLDNYEFLIDKTVIKGLHLTNLATQYGAIKFEGSKEKLTGRLDASNTDLSELVEAAKHDLLAWELCNQLWGANPGNEQLGQFFHKVHIGEVKKPRRHGKSQYDNSARNYVLAMGVYIATTHGIGAFAGGNTALSGAKIVSEELRAMKFFIDPQSVAAAYKANSLK